MILWAYNDTVKMNCLTGTGNSQLLARVVAHRNTFKMFPRFILQLMQRQISPFWLHG